MLLMSLKTDFGAVKTKNRYIGKSWRTNLIKTNLLGRFKGLRVQLANLAFILSSRSCQETYLIVPCPKGTPIYLVGKVPFVNPKILPMFLWVMIGVLKKKT